MQRQAKRDRVRRRRRVRRPEVAREVRHSSGVARSVNLTSPGPVDQATVSVQIGDGLGSIIKRVPQILLSPSLPRLFPGLGRIRSFSAFPVPCLGRGRLVPERDDLQRQALRDLLLEPNEWRPH